MKICGGALTTIWCSAIQPSFLLNETYNLLQYDQFPQLFGARVYVSPSNDNTILFVNGTAKLNNVNVKCKNVTDFIGGISETLFQLTLMFECELSIKSYFTN